jgi:hypothetical protein
MIERSDWKWFGHPAHLIVGQSCRFHLATKVGEYLISTVGEYWPERAVREIHARVHDRIWLEDNIHRKGDDFDYAYMKRFGYKEIGAGRTYESMVFKAGKPCDAPDCGCGLPEISGSELDFGGYSDAKSATEGHYELCEKWSLVTEEAHARTEA